MLSSIQRSSAPAGAQLDRAADRAERGRLAVRILELGEDVGVGLLVDVGEDVLGGRVGQADPPVAGADEDAVAHRPDHGVQLGGLGMLGLGEAPEVRLGLDPVGDVARDGDDPAVLAGRRDVLEQDLDGDRPAIAVAEREGRRARVERAADERLDEAADPDRVELLDQHRRVAGEQLLRAVAELVGGAAVHVRQPQRERVEHDDRVERRVEDALVADGLAERAGVRDRGRGSRREALGEREVLRRRSAGRTRPRRT